MGAACFFDFGTSLITAGCLFSGRESQIEVTVLISFFKMDTSIGLPLFAKDVSVASKTDPSNNILNNQFPDIMFLSEFETTGFQRTY
jgi:hypothetical protein